MNSISGLEEIPLCDIDRETTLTVAVKFLGCKGHPYTWPKGIDYEQMRRSSPHYIHASPYYLLTSYLTLTRRHLGKLNADWFQNGA